LPDKQKTQKANYGRMKSSKAFEIFPQIITHLKKGSKLTANDIENLEKLFGDRVQKALELIGEKKVKKYIFIPSGVYRWVVTGQGKDYLVIEKTFCSCRDFLFTALLRREAPSCYHLLAREIAEKIEQFEEIILDDEKYSENMAIWLS